MAIECAKLIGIITIFMAIKIAIIIMNIANSNQSNQSKCQHLDYTIFFSVMSQTLS